MKYNERHMKRTILSLLIAATLLSPVAAEKFSVKGNISIDFAPCTDGSVKIEATAKKCRAPAKQFELNVPVQKKTKISRTDDTYSWDNWKLVKTSDGYTLFNNNEEMYTASFEINDDELYENRQWKSAKAFYGFGECSREVNLVDKLFTIYNESKYGDHAYLFIPFFLTDTNSTCYYDANGRDHIYFPLPGEKQVYRSAYKRINCYVKQNDNARTAVRNFYELTQAGTMIPKWTFGFIQSKYGYKSQQEVVDLVNEFKKRSIPLDAVVLDVYWFNKMGDISWTSKDYPDPKAMDSFMEENGVKLVTITEPFFTTNSANYNELKNNGMLCKNDKGATACWSDWWCLNGDRQGSLFNPLSKNASDFMGRKYTEMLNSGIDGFWTDLGEPERAQKNVMYNNMKEEEFHNYYNFYWSKALYEGFTKYNPDQRLFIMSRSGYTGIGRFNVSVWSGDVPVNWASLGSQVAYGVNAGLCGLPYWGSDVGGFSQTDTYPELFVRWQQFGMFTPIYRAHGTGSREPWIFTDKETDIVANCIRTRETLVPYIYSTARQSMKGLPMMRGLFLEDANVPAEFIENEYMFGDNILVCPVSKTMEMEPAKNVYLPEGTWYDFETLKKYNGSQTLSVNLKYESIPVYLKAGSIIPCTKDGKDYLFLLPSEKETTFTYYNDDGTTNNYKNKNQYVEITYTLKGTDVTASVNGDRSFAPQTITLAVPSSFDTDSTWTSAGKYKTKTVSLSSIEK